MLHQVAVNMAKAKADLLALATADTTMHRVASTGGGEYAGPCPFCGGRDRFRVQPNHNKGGRWFCRGCGEGYWHDVIAYVMRRDNINFHDALAILGNDHHKIAHQKVQSQTGLPTQVEINQDSIWQDQAKKFVENCEAHLWSEKGSLALSYLCEERGLQEKTIVKYRLGYNPVDTHAQPEIWGLTKRKIWLPRGIVIPCFVEGQLWYVNIRRPSGKPKYYKVRGSRAALLGTYNLRGAWLMLLVEGEFDAMLADQEIGDVAGIATFGSAVWKIDLAAWGRYLLPARAILVALDIDSTGKKAVNALSRLSPQIHPIRIPVLQHRDKDITEYYKSGGNLWEWLKYNLENHGLVPKHETIDLSASLSIQTPSIDDMATTTSTNLSVIVNNYLAGPHEPDISRPCFACGQIVWRERPEKIGGGYYCSSCHPNVKSKSFLSTTL